MPQINLIESQILSTKRSERQLQISKFTFITTIAVFASAHFVMIAEAAGLNGQQNDVESKLKKLKPFQDQIDANKKEENNLEPRLKTLNGARDLTNRWARVMEHLSKNMPNEVWLTSFKSIATDPEKPIHITFNGVGRDQIQVSEMVLRTQNAVDLESVALVGTGEKMFEKTTGMEFEMGGDIVGTAEKKKKATAEEKDGKDQKS